MATYASLQPSTSHSKTQNHTSDAYAVLKINEYVDKKGQRLGHEAEAGEVPTSKGGFLICLLGIGSLTVRHPWRVATGGCACTAVTVPRPSSVRWGCRISASNSATPNKHIIN